MSKANLLDRRAVVSGLHEEYRAKRALEDEMSAALGSRKTVRAPGRAEAKAASSLGRSARR